MGTKCLLVGTIWLFFFPCQVTGSVLYGCNKSYFKKSMLLEMTSFLWKVFKSPLQSFASKYKLLVKHWSVFNLQSSSVFLFISTLFLFISFVSPLRFLPFDPLLSSLPLVFFFFFVLCVLLREFWSESLPSGRWRGRPKPDRNSFGFQQLCVMDA